MKRLIIPLCLLLLCLSALPSFVCAKIVSGTVYKDKKQNGSFDPKEKGIKNVSVSNGSIVVLTDKKGRYSIELFDGDTLFISKPSGFSVPLDENNLPRFYFNFDNADGFQGKNPLHQHIITTAAGSWWNGVKDIEGIPHSFQVDGTPNGYHIMSVTGNKYSLRYKAAGKPDDCQMRIMLKKNRKGTSFQYTAV